MKLKELIAFYESKLENPDLTRGSRKVATLTLMGLRRAERLNELARAGYTMNRHNLPEGEPKTERGHLYTDDTETQQFFLGGNKFYELTIDKMIRHKWPEEKPVVPDEVEFKVYLARYKIDDEFIFMDSVAYYKDTGWGTSGVTHWWELPEVKE